MTDTTHVVEEHEHVNPLVQIIYLIAGLISLLLGLRFIFVLFGIGNAQIAEFIFQITDPIVAPFYGIFGSDPTLGGARFELESLLAIAFVWIIASILAALARLIP